MSNDLLAPVWPSIRAYLADGLSIIPIRDKDDEYGVAKSPSGKTWAEWQKAIITPDELWHNMDRYKTTAIGIVAGSISGNLEVIDADEKYMPGISARLFSDLQTLYPDLYSRLRIHGTPSRGFHLLYRSPGPIPGSVKLAGRTATEAEIEATKQKGKKDSGVRNFLETRGEGGYVAAPPSLGYTVVQDVPIPIITQDDRDSIINLCKSYTYLLPPAEMKPYRPTNRDSEYYDTNPFDDFNNRCDPSAIVGELGWTEIKHNNKLVWYTRPGGSKNHVHLSFNIERRFFFCFTSSTELKEHHGYTPANLVSTILHNFDKKQTYRWLVAKGFGKIKSDREAVIAKKAATNAKPLPPNASPEAIQLKSTIEAALQEQHPHGVFWFMGEKGIEIDRDALYTVSEKMGFKLYNSILVRVISGIIHEQSDREYFDAIKTYIKEEDGDIYKQIVNSYEPFIERHGKFTISRLPILTPDIVLTDTRQYCYKPYINGVVIINGQSIEVKPYNEMVQLIWFKSINQRVFNPVPGGLYNDFLQKAIGITDYLQLCIGYLSHGFKDETTPYFIVLPERCENPEDGGGSGKNIFCKLFEHTTTFSSRSGEQVSYDDKFLQSWRGEKVFCISDPPKNFRWGFLKDLISNDAMIKKLYVDIDVIKAADMPKIIIPTNYAVDLSEAGMKRRARQIEFTDFFTKAGGVDIHYGVHFPGGWSPEDWGGYDYMITHSVQQWIASGLKIPLTDLSDTGWSKQFEQNFGQIVAGFIKEHGEVFIRRSFIINETFKKMTEDYYNENEIIQKFRPSMIKINRALNEWAVHNGLTHNPTARDRTQIGEPRGHSFLPVEAPF